ncbi:hypothetical protein HDU93_001448 [Gonapodya sp. JEL0774]|nr:hypothetical protein HDU93_001448 [Gonapodya sp. JEL0774]
MTEPIVTIGPTIIQGMVMSVYDSTGKFVASSLWSVTLQNLCTLLDNVKKTLTPNSLLYVFVPAKNGFVLAISGLGNSTMQSKSLVLNGGSKSIFDFSKEEYPLLNMSAATIYQYSGNNLTNSFADNSWMVNDYMFQVTTKSILGYRYFIVSGAPTYDFLGDTIYLTQRLKEDGLRSALIVIFTAVAIVIGMSIASVIFTWIFITTPLQMILNAMKKATKFDFSDIREGNFKNNRSIVDEIHRTQDNFVKMLQVFANALKQNKQLMNKTSARESVNALKD